MRHYDCLGFKRCCQLASPPFDRPFGFNKCVFGTKAFGSIQPDRRMVRHVSSCVIRTGITRAVKIVPVERHAPRNRIPPITTD
jgi:hypothetical protein